MTGFLPVWAQAVAAVVAILGGLGLLWRIFRKLAVIAEAVPIFLLVADQFEIPTDLDRRHGADRRDPRKVLPILIEIADQFQPNHGNTLKDQIDQITADVEATQRDVAKISARLGVGDE